MRPSRRPIVIATRRSRLAQAQANAVARALRKLNPNVTVELMLLESEGDRLVDHPLGQTSGKGLFTGVIEGALRSEQADLAVHSLKDLPTTPTAGLVIAAIPSRGDARDCLVSTHTSGLMGLPAGANVGTSSPRRATQIRQLRDDLAIAPLRGNVDTRVAKVFERKEHDAAILAMAGLIRSGLSEYANQPIDVEQLLPAPGQAALAIQCRADDHVTLRRCLALNHSMTASCVEAERQVAAELGATCNTPFAAFAEPTADGKIRLRARLLSADGKTCLESDHAATPKRSRKLAEQVTADLFAQGGKALV